METNIKTTINNPIHIEFYGLPGCGKSTISHEIADILRAEGFKVIEPSYEMDHNLSPLLRKTKKIFLTCCFCLTHRKTYKKLRDLVSKYGYIDFKDALGQIVNIVPKIYQYKHSKKAIYIWDEGLIQSAISLAVKENGYSIRDGIDALLETTYFIPVYLQLDIKEALSRMESRSSNDSRVEKEKDINAKQILMKRYEDIITQIGFHNSIDCNVYEKPIESLLKRIKDALYKGEENDKIYITPR